MTFETPAMKATATTRVPGCPCRNWGSWFVNPGAMGGRAREGWVPGGWVAAHGSSLFWPQVWGYQVYSQVECSQAQVKSKRRKVPYCKETTFW